MLACNRQNIEPNLGPWPMAYWRLRVVFTVSNTTLLVVLTHEKELNLNPRSTLDMPSIDLQREEAINVSMYDVEYWHAQMLRYSPTNLNRQQRPFAASSPSVTGPPASVGAYSSSRKPPSVNKRQQASTNFRRLLLIQELISVLLQAVKSTNAKEAQPVDFPPGLLFLEVWCCRHRRRQGFTIRRSMRRSLRFAPWRYARTLIPVSKSRGRCIQ